MSGCDRGRLLGFLDGELAERSREEVEAHLAGCASCRELLSWLRRVQRHLGPGPSGHPATGALVSHAAGELGADGASIEAHLAVCAECRGLDQAARASLAEAAAVETGLRWLAARPRATDEQPAAPPAQSRLHRGASEGGEQAQFLAVLPPAVAPRVLAATGGPAPVPEDRRVLIDDPCFRLVLYRLGARAQLGLFLEEAERRASLGVVLDGEPLPETERSPEGMTFALGVISELPGRELKLELELDGLRRTFSFRLVEA